MAKLDAVVKHRSQYAAEALSRYAPVAAAYFSRLSGNPEVKTTPVYTGVEGTEFLCASRQIGPLYRGEVP